MAQVAMECSIQKIMVEGFEVKFSDSSLEDRSVT